LRISSARSSGATNPAYIAAGIGNGSAFTGSAATCAATHPAIWPAEGAPEGNAFQIVRIHPGPSPTSAPRRFAATPCWARGRLQLPSWRSWRESWAASAAAGDGNARDSTPGSVAASAPLAQALAFSLDRQPDPTLALKPVPLELPE